MGQRLRWPTTLGRVRHQLQISTAVVRTSQTPIEKSNLAVDAIGADLLCKRLWV